MASIIVNVLAMANTLGLSKWFWTARTMIAQTSWKIRIPMEIWPASVFASSLSCPRSALVPMKKANSFPTILFHNIPQFSQRLMLVGILNMLQPSTHPTSINCCQLHSAPAASSPRSWLKTCRSTRLYIPVPSGLALMAVKIPGIKCCKMLQDAGIMDPAKGLSSTGRPLIPSAAKARKWNATQQGNCSSPETQILRPTRVKFCQMARMQPTSL